MTRFKRILSDAVKASGLNVTAYAAEWGVPARTLQHWLNGTPPSEKHRLKIEERFLLADHPGLFDEELPQVSNGLWDATETKIMLARMNITNLAFIFEWLVYEAGLEERNKFRDILGAEWESFMNLARALVNEKSREVGFTERRLHITRRKQI